MMAGLLLTGAATSIWTVMKRVSRKKQTSLHTKKKRLPTKLIKQQVVVSAAETEAIKQQHIATGALISASSAHIISPLFIAPSVLLLSYGLYLHLKKMVVSRRQKKKGNQFSIVLLDSFSIGFSIYTGLYIIASMLFLIMAIARRLTAKTEREAQTDFNRIFGELSSTVWLSVEGIEKEIPLSELKKNDTIVVHAGEIIPIDGQVVTGESLVDQHLLTGESQPVERKIGDKVMTSTLVLSGVLYIMVEKQGSETVTGQIAQTLQHASTFKNQMQSRGEKIVEKGASLTLLSCATAIPLMGVNVAMALSYSGFGYQMRTAAPLMVLNYLRIASRNGILIKDGRALDTLSSVDTIVFDKTGTLTEEIPAVARIIGCGDISDQQILQYAASAEQRQKHPIAQAICQAANKQAVTLLPLVNNDCQIGYGLRASFEESGLETDGQAILIGSRNFINMAGIKIPNNIEQLQIEVGEKGHSIVYVAVENGELLGIIELQPSIRPQTEEAITALHKMGMKLYIVSGDQEKPTRYLAETLGMDDYFSEILPQGKADIIKQLKAQGRKICFIGDGINDSIALQKADVSISLQGAATIAQDTADIVLMTPDLMHLPYLVGMARELDKRMSQSMFMNNASGVTCVSGVLLFGMGLSGAVLLYSGGLLGNISMAMLPLLQRGKDTKNIQGGSKQPKRTAL
jgi:Cu2+-exporting ATPase